MEILLRVFLLDLSINFVGWCISAAAKTHKNYDLVGSVSYLLCTAVSLFHSDRNLVQKVQSLLIIVWALRLGIYLFSRALKRGDARMKKYDDQPLRFLIPFFLQTLWVFIMSSPTYLLNKTSSPELTFSVYFGWTIWGIGFIIEALADYQKSVFLDDEANDGKFIKTGLWSISRHPNYFGEIMLWSGLFISAAGSFTSSIEYLSIFSIAFIYLLLRYVSGVSLLEKNGEKRWGHQPDYQKYCSTVPILMPFVSIYK